MVRHLGVQMYSGAVGAVAELIANAWDADAPEVHVSIPFDQDWDSQTEIQVHDNGRGMSFQDCNDLFLLIGRDRRQQGDYTNQHRKVMGRKGIGKLACFGVGKIIEVKTVRDGWLTHFALDYDKIMEQSQGELVSKDPYRPTIIADGKTDEANGTTIILRRIQLKRTLSEDKFRDSMARRFAILGDDFRLYINNNLLKRTEMPFQFRFPAADLARDSILGTGNVRWWIGFTEKPIPDEDARGIVVMVRGKLAQAPFFFGLSGGLYGQHGMQYLTGEVHADDLDDRRDVDVVATDRASIRWEDYMAAPLLEWGANKIKALLSEWVDLRTENNINRLKIPDIPYWDRINRFQERERREITRAVRQFANIEGIDEKRFIELVDLFLKAYENDQFMQMIRAINALDDTQQVDLFKLIAEANILEAVETASIVRVKVEVIRKFRQLIGSKAREKPDMQDVLKLNPWLLNPGWNTLEHEKTLDNVITEYFQEQGTAGEEKDRRIDIFCLADSLRVVVVEVKRPGLTVGKKEIIQIMDYVDHLRKWAGRGSDPDRRMTIQGYLIATQIRPEDLSWRERAEKEAIYVRDWGTLLAAAEQLWGEFLDLVKSKAPSDDPRIQALNPVGLADDSTSAMSAAETKVEDLDIQAVDLVPSPSEDATVENS